MTVLRLAADRASRIAALREHRDRMKKLETCTRSFCKASAGISGPPTS